MSAERSLCLHRLAAIARRQHGLFTHRQALQCGISKSYIFRQRRDRLWVAVEPLVYRHAAAEPLSWRQRTLALVLATDGVASGRSAAALYGLREPPRTPEVTVVRSRRSCRHRRPDVRSFDGELGRDTTRVDRIPATTPALTLITLGDIVGQAAVRDAVDAAIVRGLVTPRRLAERATTLWAPRRKGCAAVLEALSSAHPELWRARNEWEHTVRRVFDDDRERQNLLVDAGWRLYRITATRLRGRPEAALGPLLRALRVNR